VSTNHLTRLFKQNSGLTPKHYITKLRISKSAELLGQADKNIIEIAYMTGFNSLSNFYKHFKEQVGQTPNEYRKSRGVL
ncbi:MAG: helix-turn-helix transcriptional regulator, partial [Clostridiaceae bacterium]|nr:helix-turn-helix transcriptional regulator [Clostridiaceae bacterium]